MITYEHRNRPKRSREVRTDQVPLRPHLELLLELALKGRMLSVPGEWLAGAAERGVSHGQVLHADVPYSTRIGLETTKYEAHLPSSLTIEIDAKAGTN